MPILLLFLLASRVAQGDSGSTALGALKLLPKEAFANLALIEAFDGRPSPDKWHILVHDAKEEAGVREFVVAAGEIVTSRTVSQFAEELKPSDVIGGEAIKFDTDRVVKLAQRFAQTNKVPVAAYNFELKRDGNASVPLWHLTCLDEQGDSVGKLIVTATKGAVVSHDGFAEEPSDSTPTPTPAKAARPEHKPEVRRAEPVRPPPVLQVPPPPEEPRPGLLRRVFGGGRTEPR